MKKSEAQLNIQTYKNKKVSSTNTTISYALWYALAQVNLVCTCVGYFGMHRRRLFWYTQAQVILLCASAGHFGMRKRRSFWYAQAHSNLICAGAGHFLCASAGQTIIRTRSLFLFSMRKSIVWYPVTHFYCSNKLQFFLSKICFFFTIAALDNFRMCFIFIK